MKIWKSTLSVKIFTFRVIFTLRVATPLIADPSIFLEAGESGVDRVSGVNGPLVPRWKIIITSMHKLLSWKQEVQRSTHELLGCTHELLIYTYELLGYTHE